MPDLVIDENGNLLDAKGELVKIGDEPAKVTNAQTKEKSERVIEERLARQNDKINTLQAQANKTPELQKLLDDAIKEKAEFEQQLAHVKENAEKEVANQITKLSQERDTYRTQLEGERTARVQEQVTNQILAKSGDKFIDTERDVVPRLLQVHKREQLKDPTTGKPLEGQFVDLFELKYKEDPKSEVEVTKLLPIEKALEVFAGNVANAHYLKPSGTNGSGGGNYTPGTGGQKRSTMTPAEKAAYAGQHGVEAYQALPE